jgi:predicted secreted hydrolase
MKISTRAASALLVSLMFVAPVIFGQYKKALPGYHYEFPRDYFSHPDYQTEWWYYTGNLRSADGRRFGFELTFFRSGVSRNRTGGSSAWGVGDLYVAHFALSDVGGKRFLHTERTNRSGPGIAGVDEAQKKVWNGNWSVTWENGGEHLLAQTEKFGIDLELVPRKPPVIHGQNGVSQKSEGAGRASHYFSETRLQVTGSLAVNSEKRSVQGQAWMDHEFFTEQLAADQMGWDWLSLQLNDNSELMLFHIRRKDGSIDPFSSGTYVDAKGKALHLTDREFQLSPSGEYWTSSATKGKYPIGWKIQIPELQLKLEIKTPLAAQELAGGSSFTPSYWEGAIDIAGERQASAISGEGYLEMTGYGGAAPRP